MDRLDLKRKQIAEVLCDRTDREPLTVGDLMTAAPTTVRASTTVLDLVRALQKLGFRHLLVENEDGTLAGILSDRDVIRCFGPERYPDERRLSSITASEIMSCDVITAGPVTPVAVAIEMMIVHGISSLPIVVNEKVVGILTNTDLHLLLQSLLSSGTGLAQGAETHAMRV